MRKPAKICPNCGSFRVKVSIKRVKKDTEHVDTYTCIDCKTVFYEKEEKDE